MKFSRIFSGIKGKVLINFFSIITLFCIYGIISAVLLTQNKNATERINTVSQPSITYLTELELMLNESKSLTSSWIKNDIEKHPDKDKLKQLHKKDYPKLKSEIVKLQKDWDNQAMVDSLTKLLNEVEKNFTVQKEIMTSLSKFEHYTDVIIKMDADGKFDQVNAGMNNITANLHKLLSNLKAITSSQQLAMIDNMEWLAITNIFLLIGIIVVGLVFTLRLSNQIIKPVRILKSLVEKVSRGELDNLSIKPSNDEIGDMMLSVQSMIDGQRTTATFANDIGKGNLDSVYSPLSEKDVLGNALITMRDNLVLVAKEDRQRNWANEGYAQFGEILRSHHENMNVMLDEFLSKLVKYINANQGWLYTINDETEDEFLELKSVYAFDRKKFINKTIQKGEGLAGQAWIEGDLIYITDVPENYVTITSGLGDATPRSILIMPLKVNENINGVIEFASFKEFSPYQIEFIQKLSESLSSTLSTLKINIKTKVLLEESQKQRQQMHEQEEEMRQNLEELQATQEEMQRKHYDTEEQIRQLKENETALRNENSSLQSEIQILKQK